MLKVSAKLPISVCDFIYTLVEKSPPESLFAEVVIFLISLEKYLEKMNATNIDMASENKTQLNICENTAESDLSSSLNSEYINIAPAYLFSMISGAATNITDVPNTFSRVDTALIVFPCPTCCAIDASSLFIGVFVIVILPEPSTIVLIFIDVSDNQITASFFSAASLIIS